VPPELPDGLVGPNLARSLLPPLLLLLLVVGHFLNGWSLAVVQSEAPSLKGESASKIAIDRFDLLEGKF
jgi:hypothetical protein